MGFSGRVTDREFVSLVGWMLILGVVLAFVMNLWLLGAALVVAGVLSIAVGRVVEAVLAIVAGIVLWVWVGPSVHDYFEYGRDVPELFATEGTTVAEARESLAELGFGEIRLEEMHVGLEHCTVLGTEPKAGERADVREPITIINGC